MRDDEPRPVWMSLPITHWDPSGTRYFNTGCACFPWFLSFGNQTQNSRVAGARPNHQPIGGSDPNHQGIWSPPRAGLGPVRNLVL